jgi:sortase A
MKKNIFTIIIVLIFVAGLSVFLFPLISDMFNTQSQARIVMSYHESVNDLENEVIEEMLKAAYDYNASLGGRQQRFLQFTETEYEQYKDLLNIAGRGIMGTLEIPLIDVNLPIYHGTSDGVLQIGIGHMEGSSLPVGGTGTHAVITGHRGLPSSMLLTNLDRLLIGDTFMIRVLGETLTYQVDQIVIVDPEDFRELRLIQGGDYVTLITCTPYGINSHRILVRGTRVETGVAIAMPVRNVILPEATRVGVSWALLGVLAPVVTIIVSVKLMLNFKGFLRRRTTI